MDSITSINAIRDTLRDNQLLFNNILYVKQHKYKCGIADFWLPETNTIVEIDGEYWHNKIEVRERDKRQTKWLEENYYNVLRFTDKEINNNIQQCINKIRAEIR